MAQLETVSELENFRVYTVDPDEIVDQLGDPERLTPRLFPEGGGMKRFVTDPLLGFRAGHTKLSRGQGFSTYFWYDEFWVARRGRGRVVATHRGTGETVTREIGPNDTVFIGKGCHIEAQGISEDEPWLFFYVAIPASNRDGAWLAHMVQADIDDVRKREEYLL